MNRKMRRASQADQKRSATAPRPPTVEPDFIEALLTHGRALLESGQAEEAMEVAKQAVRLKESEESKAFFVTCVRRWAYFPGADEMRDVIARALRESWALPGDLEGITKEILKRDALIGPAFQRAMASWPRLLSLHELLGTAGLSKISIDPLLLALLEMGRVFGIEIERFLTSIRAGLLEIATQDHGHQNEGMLRFCCALARQCYNNEYVFNLTPDENGRLQTLLDQITEALNTGAAVSPMAVAVLSAYVPLNCLPVEALGKRPWPEGVVGLQQQQIYAPAAVRELRDSIARITPIADDTSIKVRGQYEDNPYPRWTNSVAFGRPMLFNEYIRQNFPSSRFREIGATAALDILIAGCGTGQQSIFFAQNFVGARVLAIDLSLSSLCYAKQKSQMAGMQNVEYAQADILELGSLGNKFDFISSSGVLHHLGDTEKGWCTLLSLLRPDGCMQVGLYSKLARRDIVVAQAWMSEHVATPSVENIRAARQELAAAAASNAALNSMLRIGDFYSTSECRDLLLPAHERQYTIPQIQAFLDENGLEFLGFHIGGYERDQFRARFSRHNETNLQLWHEFEIEYPDTFKGTYIFWVQKKRPKP